MSNEHVHPIFRGLLDAISPPRLPDGLTGESLASSLRAHGIDARVVHPLDNTGPLEPEPVKFGPIITAFDDLAPADKLDAVQRAAKQAVYECALIEALPNSDDYEIWIQKLADSAVADAEVGRLAREIVCKYMGEVARCRGDELKT